MTGRGQQTYKALSDDDAKGYDAIKAAVLERYDVNTEAFRQQFREARLKNRKPPKKFVQRLQSLAGNWLLCDDGLASLFCPALLYHVCFIMLCKSSNSMNSLQTHLLILES